ncbi:TonB-dependent receptor [Algicola sagamiensis]|uniref:TonB-dependent receptor n=1 Tax=Algicola sagamiensis TaxID=163869 RepID=UPI00035D351C|nr:TonB-dependent receptor [Algicola sagamiensis]
MKKKVIAAAVSALLFNTPIQAEEQQILKGRIVDESGQPVYKAKVHFHGHNHFVTTDKDGYFSIKGIKKLDELHISASEFEDKTLQLTDQAKSPIKVTLSQSNIEHLVVYSSGLHKSSMEMTSPVTVLSGESLKTKAEPTLGETLKSEPGIHSSYFGPVSSSPVIRGMDGPRVKITQNGLDTSDASRVGPDHATTTESISAEQIEVLRGPATLLYGSGAIGGVVNVIDNRIPREQKQETDVKFDSRYNSVSDETMLAVNLDTKTVNGFSVHVDAFNRITNDYEIPDEPHHDEDEGDHEAHANNKLANSDIDTQGVNAGISWSNESGLIGFSVGHLSSVYGIPGHVHEEEGHGHDDHGHEDEHDHEEAERVFADMSQRRYQLAAELYNPVNGLESINFLGSYTDYQHTEFENGQPGTRFENDSYEFRLTAEHETVYGWHGIFGMHYQKTDFSAVGDEAFTPASESTSWAVFALEEKKLTDELTLELGVRVEKNKVDAPELLEMQHGHGHDDDDDHEDDHDSASADSYSKSFTNTSASAGLNYQFTEAQSIAVSFAYAERSPSAAELLSNGIHISTSTYDVGALYAIHECEQKHGFDCGEAEFSPDRIEKEKAKNIDLIYRLKQENWSGEFNVFMNQVDNFVYQENTGKSSLGEEHGDHFHAGMPIFHYRQADAEFYGYELSVDYALTQNWELGFNSDYTRAKLVDGGNLPRIPPMRIGGEVGYLADNWDVTFETTYYSEQDKLADHETRTAGYTMHDISYRYYVNLDYADFTLYVKGTNLTDKFARSHASFIKNEAPLPGRAISLGVRGTF